VPLPDPVTSHGIKVAVQGMPTFKIGRDVDLATSGLQVDAFTIQSIADESGYIDPLGRQKLAVGERTPAWPRRPRTRRRPSVRPRRSRSRSTPSATWHCARRTCSLRRRPCP
jgi:hypothetical protein